MSFCSYYLEKKELHFKQPAGTSRGVYMTRKIWLVTLSDGEHQGVGECAPLPDLSCDALPDETYEAKLHHFCQRQANSIPTPCATTPPCSSVSKQPSFPSQLFTLHSQLFTRLCRFALRRTSHFFSTPPSVGAKKVFPSTDSCGWAVTMRCSSASKRNWRKASVA